jgi:hypothetical protein
MDTILALHPVRFCYQTHGPESPLQYGLIAEEVAKIAPDLAARNKDGEIETGYYGKVNVMLLNEVQRLTREKDALAERGSPLWRTSRSTAASRTEPLALASHSLPLHIAGSR